MECIKKNTAIFLHTLCIFVCYVSNEHDDDMALNTKQRQKCINRFLFQFFIRIFTRLTEDISVALFIWFSSHTPKNWLSRYASSVIHWNVYVFVCAFFFPVDNEWKRVPKRPEFYLHFLLASSEFNKPNCVWIAFENEIHIWHGYIPLHCQHPTQFN